MPSREIVYPLLFRLDEERSYIRFEQYREITPGILLLSRSHTLRYLSRDNQNGIYDATDER